MNMNSPTAQFVNSTRMGMYEPMQQFNMWTEFKTINAYPNTSPSPILDVDAKLDNQSDDTSQGTFRPLHEYEKEAARPADKVLRRLAQNREAARKSRIRKKAYVKQLETGRLRLIQLELELEQARQQGMLLGGGLDTTPVSFSGNLNPDIGLFLMEYGHWVEEQDRKTCELRMALDSNIADIELGVLVEDCIKHYFALFSLKANAARADVFYVMSGMWKASAERFFLWIGGFRPSEVLQALLPQLDLAVADQQLFFNICSLRQSCQQAEDALSQGKDKLQQTLTETIAGTRLIEGHNIAPLHVAMEKLEDLISFVNQADHLRQETLEQMTRLLSIRQAAKGLLALGEYCHRLRALSTLWEAQPQKPA